MHTFIPHLENTVQLYYMRGEYNEGCICTDTKWAINIPYFQISTCKEVSLRKERKKTVLTKFYPVHVAKVG